MRTLAMVVFVSALVAAAVVFLLCLPAVGSNAERRGALEPADVRRIETRDAAECDASGADPVAESAKREATVSVMGPGYNPPPPYVPVS